MFANLQPVVKEFYEFTGAEKFAKFASKIHGLEKRRLAFWQQQLWDQFCVEHVEYGQLTFDEIHDRFQICEVHLCALKSDTVPLIYGFHIFADEDRELRDNEFPHSNEFQLRKIEWADRSQDNLPVEAEVMHCAKCRQLWKQHSESRVSLTEHVDWLGNELSFPESQDHQFTDWPFDLSKMDFDPAWIGWEKLFIDADQSGCRVQRFADSNFQFSKDDREIVFLYRGRGYIWELRLMEFGNPVSLGWVFSVPVRTRVSINHCSVARALTLGWLAGSNELDLVFGLSLNSSGILTEITGAIPVCSAECQGCRTRLIDGPLSLDLAMQLESKHNWVIDGLKPDVSNEYETIYVGRHATVCPRCGFDAKEMRWESVLGPSMTEFG